MNPIDVFKLAWARCDELTGLQAYLSANAAAIVSTDELLRAEWVARVSALDLYVHELVAQSLVKIFDSIRPQSAAFKRLEISGDTLLWILNAQTKNEKRDFFELNIRQKLKIQTFQDPEKIADAIRLISDIELWNSIAAELGANGSSQKQEMAKNLKKSLSVIVDRRNKIAHEGDMLIDAAAAPWPINVNDLLQVRNVIYPIVMSINKLVW